MIELPVRARVQPFAIPGIAPIHYAGIFGDFHELVRLRRQEAARRRRPDLVALYEELLARIDADAYAEIQRRHLELLLDCESLEHGRGLGFLKYLDACHWISSKYGRAKRHLGLHRVRGRSILDLGTGPGHAPWVFGFLGHEALGFDMPLEPWSAGATRHLYDDLCEIFGVRKLAGTVAPYEPLPGFGRRFDVVTAFMVKFSSTLGGEPWPRAAWSFFLADVFDRVLEPGGCVYLTVTRGCLSEDSWEMVAAKAALTDKDSRTLRIERWD